MLYETVASKAAWPAFVLAAWLGVASAAPVAAQAPMQVAVEVRVPRPNAFFVLSRAPEASIAVERLPAHLRASFARSRRVTARLRSRYRARMLAMRALDERSRGAGHDAAPGSPAVQQARRSERRRLAEEFADIDSLERQERRLLRAARLQARRCSPTHGLGQLALAELEFASAAADFIEAMETYERELDAGREPADPPEHPSYGAVLPAAERAAGLLRGRWRASALYLHAYASLELGAEVGAVASLQALLAMPDGPLHAEAALRRGELAFEAGDWPLAARHYHRALAEPRLQRIATYKLAWAELRAGRWAEARDAAVELVDDDHEPGVEARRVLLPRALARVADHEGDTLPPGVPPEHRAAVLLALSELLLDQLGDVAASRVALEAAASAGADVGQVTARRQTLDRLVTDQRRLERWVRSTLWECAPGATLLSFSATARFSGSAIGYVEVLDAGPAQPCLEQRFSNAPPGGAVLRVDVARRD